MTAMNQNQLRAIFHYLKVPASAYDLGNNTRLGACETIEHTLQGWEVYATERGSKCAVKVFSNETDACYNLLYRMTHYCDIDKTLPNLTIRKLAFHSGLSESTRRVVRFQRRLFRHELLFHGMDSAGLGGILRRERRKV